VQILLTNILYLTAQTVFYDAFLPTYNP